MIRSINPVLLTAAFTALVLNIDHSHPVMAEEVTYPYRYAYVAANGPNYDFHFVDPTNPDHSAIVKSIAKPDGSDIYDLSPSPNGKWLTVGSDIVQNGKVYTAFKILNVASQQLSSSIVPAAIMPSRMFYGWNGYQPSVDVIWSPNSQYLAFNMIDNDYSPRVNIYLYSLITGQLIAIPANDNELHYRMAWSPDSNQIVMTGEQCSSVKCILNLETFDTTGKITQSIDVSGLDSLDLAGGLAICQLEWSPGDIYISFVSTCFPPYASVRNVYLWSLGSNSLTEIHLGNKQVTTAFHLIWYDDNNLIISAYHPGSTMETLLYQSSSNSVTSLFSNWIIDSASSYPTAVLAKKGKY